MKVREIALALDRLVVAGHERFLTAVGPAHRVAVDGNGLDPVDHVLQFEVAAHDAGDLERRPRVARLGPDVEEKRPVLRKRARKLGHPRVDPVEIALARDRVVVRAVFDADVVRR